MSTLKLTLSYKPFQVMKTGEKDVEFRRKSKWIESRLFDKNGNIRRYTQVEFVNGYGATKPRFITEFKNVVLVEPCQTFSYSNGLTINITEPTYMIILGKLLY